MSARPVSRRVFFAAGLAAAAAGLAPRGSSHKYRFIDIYKHVGTFWRGRELTAAAGGPRTSI